MDRYEKTFTVRWADCDANGHMRNTAYSEYGTEVRMAYLTEGGFGFDRFLETKVGPVMLREEIDYLRELRMGARITVSFTALGLSPDGARFRLQHEVVREDGKLSARVTVDGGWMDLHTRRLAPPPAALADLLRNAPRGGSWEELPNVGEKRAR
jgi:acyl-CoA thioester hydrolase